LSAGIIGGWLAACGHVAQAFTISSAVSAGCHEKVTTDALRAVRLELAAAAPLGADRNDRALIDDLQFAPTDDMTDLGGATLLLGVRDNDLQGHDALDASQLALVHGNPGTQMQHCLRGAHEEGSDGAQAALEACRNFILERVGQALEGLDETGAPDPGNRTSLRVYLALRHGVNAPLPTYYVRMGQALHTVEDSFTHTFRTTDGMAITTLLDWVDVVNRDFTEANDGPPHSTELDRCDDPDDLRRRRRELATLAATAVLRATLVPGQTHDQKMAGVKAALDAYLGYSPGWTFDNGWCDAPEHAYSNGSALGCDVGGSGSGGAVPTWSGVPLAALAALFARGRRRRRVLLALGVAWLVVVASPRAFAQAPVPEPGPPAPARTALGGYVGGSGSISDEAFAGTLGARLRLTKHWTFGVDGEWNPFIAVNGASTVRAGAFNLYGTVIFRLPLAYEKFNLRITGNAGMSRLLIDLYGAPKGSTGLYAGLAPLGLEWKMSCLFYLIVNPLNVAVPVPQLRGVPFSYPQYRASVGLELYVD